MPVRNVRNVGTWLAAGVLLLLLLAGLAPLFVGRHPELAASLEAALHDGWVELPNVDGHRVEIDRAFGFVMKTHLDGEPVPEERAIFVDGILDVLDEQGGLVAQAPVDVDDEAEWLAVCPWPRLGLFGEHLGPEFLVRSVRPESPASQAGVVPGDRVLTLGGYPAVTAGVRAALLFSLSGGSVPAEVATESGKRAVSFELAALLPAEVFAESQDPLRDWVDHHEARESRSGSP